MGEDSFQAPADEHESKKDHVGCIWKPMLWLKMLAAETHWSFVLAVVVVYGISQGLGGSIFKVSTEYYMKDVQRVQPSEAQFYAGIASIPWIVKPLWGLLTDIVPVLGYRRRPYFILAGFLVITSMLLLSFPSKLPLIYALLALTAGSAGAAISDVTVDACVAQNSNIHPWLAADMQSLCAISSAMGALLGYGVSGIFVHLIGPKGVFGLLTLPAGLLVIVGTLLKEFQMPALLYEEVNQRFRDATKAMWTTLKHPSIWKPCLYMYLSLALCLHIHEGMFYWYTDSPEGPSLSKEAIGYISSIGSVGSLMGALLFQYILKKQPFRDLLFWTQLLFAASGMLDLLLVLRINLKFGIPDYFFIVIDTSVSHMIGRLKWMPLLVLSSKLCPPGIEGTFFALLMSIDNVGLLTASWFGGLLLHTLNVTRTQFESLWLAIFIRNVLRLAPLGLLFLVPRADLESFILPAEIAEEKMANDKDVELATLVRNGD